MTAVKAVPWRMPSDALDLRAFDDLLTEVDGENDSSAVAETPAKEAVTGHLSASAPGAPKKQASTESLDLARFLKTAQDPNKRQRVMQDDADVASPKNPFRQSSLSKFAVEMFGDSIDSPRAPLVATGNVPRVAPRTPVTDLLAAAAAAGGDQTPFGSAQPADAPRTVTAPVPAPSRRSKRMASKPAGDLDDAPTNATPPLVSAAHHQSESNSDGFESNSSADHASLRNAASAPLDLGIDDASAADIILRRRLQNRAASARHRQRIKDREHELDRVKDEIAALKRERDDLTRAAATLNARNAELEAAAAAQPARERQLQEQAMLYVVNRFWLRRKMHFPTIGRVVKGVMSLSLHAKNAGGVAMDVAPSSSSAAVADQPGPRDFDAAADLPMLGRGDSGRDLAALEGVRAWGMDPSLPTLEEVMAAAEARAMVEDATEEAAKKQRAAAMNIREEPTATAAAVVAAGGDQQQ